MAGCDAAYVVAPNFHPRRAGVRRPRTGGLPRRPGVGRVVYHSVASRTSPRWRTTSARPRPSTWSPLRAGLDDPPAGRLPAELRPDRGPVQVPYDVHARFGFLDLADLGRGRRDGAAGGRARRGDVRAGQPERAASPSSRPRPGPRPSGWPVRATRPASTGCSGQGCGRCSPTTTQHGLPRRNPAAPLHCSPSLADTAHVLGSAACPSLVTA